MMRVVVRRPRLPELTPWVSALWWCQGVVAAESVLPAGRAQLVLPLGVGAGWETAVLHGPASRPRLVEPVRAEPLVGVVFRPGGLRPFSGAPAFTLADLSVPLPELQGFGGRQARPGPGCCIQSGRRALTRLDMVAHQATKPRARKDTLTALRDAIVADADQYQELVHAQAETTNA